MDNVSYYCVYLYRKISYHEDTATCLVPDELGGCIAWRTGVGGEDWEVMRDMELGRGHNK